MFLYLMRHAEAVVSSPDPERILSDNGRTQIPRILKLIPRSILQSISLIEHSPYRRATETAELLQKHGLPHAELRVLPGITPEDPPSTTAQNLAISPASQPRLIVGHNPHIALLASLLLSGGHLDAAFGPATCMALERYSPKDQAAPLGYWRLLWFITPELG